MILVDGSAWIEYLRATGSPVGLRLRELYRHYHAEGAKVRRLPECVIAIVAMRRGASLLHADSDFDAIARCSSLEIATARS